MYEQAQLSEQGGHAFLPLAWFRPPIHVRACQINARPILRGCLLARRMGQFTSAHCVQIAIYISATFSQKAIKI